MADEATKTEVNEEEFWDTVLADIDSGSGNFLFFKEGRTRIRLLKPAGANHPRDCFTKVNQSFRGKPRTKYAFYCYRPDDLANDQVPDDQLIKVAIAPKTAFKDIVILMKEGYKFFHETNGNGVIVIRSGTGLNSDYSAAPSPNAVPVPPKIQELMKEKTMEQAVEEWDKFQSSRATATTETEADGANLQDGW